MSAVLASCPAELDANGKVITYGYTVTMSKGTSEQRARFEAWVDKIVSQRLADDRAALPAAGADV